MWWTKWNWKRFFPELFEFPSPSSHQFFIITYVVWGMDNVPISGCSSTVIINNLPVFPICSVFLFLPSYISSPCSKELNIAMYPKPVESIPQLYTLFIKYLFQCQPLKTWQCSDLLLICYILIFRSPSNGTVLLSIQSARGQPRSSHMQYLFRWPSHWICVA